MTERILKMPRLGETMEEGRIVRWLKVAGDAFRRSEGILDIETDKTVAEFPALVDGKLVEILRQEGDMVMVGDAIARIEVAADAIALESEAPISQPDTASAPEALRRTVAENTRHERRVRATPLARRIAREKDIDINRLSGSGRRGRIEKEDVHLASGEPPASPGVQFVELGKGRIAYADQGSPDAPVFLLLHGFSGDRTIWSGVASGLRRGNFRVITPDLPAHGLTTVEAGDVDELAAFLPAFLDALSVDKVYVVAHSLGAVAATEFATANPARVRGLALLAPVGLGSEIDSGFISGMASATTSGEISHLLRRISVGTFGLSPELAADYARKTAGGRLKGLADAIVGPSGQQRIDIIAPLEYLSRSTPVHVLIGLHDRIVPWRQVVALPPLICVHFFAQSGHMPQWDQAREVVELISRSAGIDRCPM